MKYKIVTLILSVFFSATISANSLDKLKTTPATKFEVGKLRLDMMRMFLSQTLEGKRVGKTKFKVEEFRVVDTGDKLLLVGDLIGKTKYINNQQCTYILNGVSNSRSGTLSNIPKELWPELSPQEHKLLNEDVKLSIKLISKDNKNFFVQC